MTLSWRSELRIDAAKRHAHERANEAVREASEALLERANQRVPRATGELEASGHVEELGDGRAAVAYDDPKARYLVAHPEHDYADGRSGLWLFEALEDGRDELSDGIVNSIRSGWPG